MKEVIFVAPYPDEKNIKEGMMQRVRAIDDIYKNIPRTYLEISFTKYFFPTVRRVRDKNVKIVYLNFITGFFHIFFYLNESTKVYCHSVYCFIKIIPHIFFYHKHLIVDMHGVVPEEAAYQDKRWLLISFYNLYEEFIFSKSSSIICVTNQMVKYYNQKYPSFKGNFYVYTILPSNLMEYSINDSSQVKNVTVIYSGNIQKWQNIELMLQAIRRTKSSSIKYKIFTMSKREFNDLLDKHQIDKEDYNLIVESILPSELHNYYIEANYGFILRDDDVVNKVANPTKLVEYLYYGITPIVLQPYIGDYKEYDFLLLENFDQQNLKPGKSLRNKNIIEKAREVNNKINLIDI